MMTQSLGMKNIIKKIIQIFNEIKNNFPIKIIIDKNPSALSYLK